MMVPWRWWPTTSSGLQYSKMRRQGWGHSFPWSRSRCAASCIASGLFAKIEVEQTDNPDSLVIALCEYRPELAEQEIATRLEDIWRHAVAYQFWEAHTTFVDADHVEFEAATRPDSTGRYVTLHLVAQRTSVPAQREASD